MIINAIELTNVRSFQHLSRTDFSNQINIFIGPNNSGKSTILNSILLLQVNAKIDPINITIGERSGYINLFVTGMKNRISKYSLVNAKIIINLFEKNIKLHIVENSLKSIEQFPAFEPENIIYPYLTKRKVTDFVEKINSQNANSVTGNFKNLNSKIDRLISTQNVNDPFNFKKICSNILGFEITTIASPGGKKSVYYLDSIDHIDLKSLGEGVTNLVGLITDLCVSENKIFLIEEPENDIHPDALKKILELIIEKSKNNQFFISTHSNIVMNYLGGSNVAKIFNVNSECSDPNRPKLFVSTVKEVQNIPEERIHILDTMGYEFSDLGHWAGWLFLEESSAEVIIRDWFIKWYAPKLENKLRTYSSNSTSKIIQKFDDFNKLFTFIYLEPIYKNKVWVILDAGEEESGIIDKFKDVYINKGWDDNNFSQFDNHDFESYYPSRFKEKVNSTLSISNKQDKRTSKLSLLNEVKEWIKNNEETAKSEFQLSASSVIEKLKEIEEKLIK